MICQWVFEPWTKARWDRVGGNLSGIILEPSGTPLRFGRQVYRTRPEGLAKATGKLHRLLGKSVVDAPPDASGIGIL